MTRQQKIKSYESRGYKVIFVYRPSSGKPLFTVWIRSPFTMMWKQYSSVNDAYKHRPWK